VHQNSTFEADIRVMFPQFQGLEIEMSPTELSSVHSVSTLMLALLDGRSNSTWSNCMMKMT